MYELLKYVHILCAMAWVGGGFFAELLAMRAARSSDPEEFPRTARQLDYLVGRVFIPASLALFVAGAAMTAMRWSFLDTWIALAILAWLAAILGGSMYLGPMAKRAFALFDAEGPASMGGRALLGRLFGVTRLELVMFAVVVALMVAKPSLG
jgi:uncharacterized membrane protein